MLNLHTKSQIDRWYNLDPIPIQLKLVADNRRFIVVMAGRRSGKTERAKRKIVKACNANPNSLYFIAAPTYNQVKKIYWADIKKLCLTNLLNKIPSESNLIVYFNNGTELHLIGLDKPNRIEGVPWDGGIIDEAAYIKEDAWTASIYPSLQTRDPSRPDRPKPWCWLIGKPKGFNHFTELYDYAVSDNDPEWGGYHWKSSEVLDKETIEAAKRTLPKKVFLEEFEASPQTTSNLIYDDYGPENYTTETIQDHELIHYFCDFNLTPMSHGILVQRPIACDVKTRKEIMGIFILDNIVLDGAHGDKNILEFVERYKNHRNKKIRLYGDSSGRQGEKHSLASEYTTMEAILADHGWTVDRRVQTKNPSIKDSQNAVRAKICNALGQRFLFVNPETAPWVHKGLRTLEFKEGSSFQEDEKNQYQHITTGLRYFMQYEYAIDDAIMDISDDIVMWGDEAIVKYN